jgi:hypothetical protein
LIETPTSTVTMTATKTPRQTKRSMAWLIEMPNSRQMTTSTPTMMRKAMPIRTSTPTTTPSSKVTH